MNRSHALAFLLAAGLVSVGCSADDSEGGDTQSTMNPTSGASDTGSESDPTGNSMDTSAEEGADTASSTGSGACPGGSTDLTHDADLQPIWDSYCLTGCHEPGGTWEFMDLSPGIAYESIVEETAIHTQATGVNLVEPGDSDASYLWHKVNGTQVMVPGGLGEDMPFVCDVAVQDCPPMDGPLPADALATIQEWIDCGAPE